MTAAKSSLKPLWCVAARCARCWVEDSSSHKSPLQRNKPKKYFIINIIIIFSFNYRKLTDRLTVSPSLGHFQRSRLRMACAGTRKANALAWNRGSLYTHKHKQEQNFNLTWFPVSPANPVSPDSHRLTWLLRWSGSKLWFQRWRKWFQLADLWCSGLVRHTWLQPEEMVLLQCRWNMSGNAEDRVQQVASTSILPCFGSQNGKKTLLHQTCTLQVMIHTQTLTKLFK